MSPSTLHIRKTIEQDVQDTASARESILKTVAYYDIFHYPLTADEIRQFMDRSLTESGFLKGLYQLVEEKKIHYHNGFYSIQDNPLLSHRRRQGNQSAEKLLVKAVTIGRFLYQFPFVRAIGVSGSLSKNYADEKADIDFFIITKEDRLWIARTFMHFYKKFTFLFGRQHFYCMNYYIDERVLLLDDKNIFTAIEIKTLLPVSGTKVMQDFFASNDWSDKWLPACQFRTQSKKDRNHSWIKRLLEWTLDGKMGNILDNWFFHVTRKRWKRKAEKGSRNKKGQPMELNTGKHFARSNPGAFQEKVLAMYEKKLELLKVL